MSGAGAFKAPPAHFLVWSECGHDRPGVQGQGGLIAGRALAALNRLYFTRFELKQLRTLVAKMELAPPRLAERLEELFRLEPDRAAAELGRLVEETRAIVASELPDLELPLRFPPGTRQQPWSIERNPADGARH